jgi:hypothetical protein
VAFQDEWLKLGKKVRLSQCSVPYTIVLSLCLSASRLTIQFSVAGVLEKKLSIFEKALQTHPDSERLLIGYLTTAQRAWEYPPHTHTYSLSLFLFLNSIAQSFSIVSSFLFECNRLDERSSFQSG